MDLDVPEKYIKWLESKLDEVVNICNQNKIESIAEGRHTEGRRQLAEEILEILDEEF